MKRTSLRFRLVLLSLITISVALVATTYALNERFYRYFQDRVYAELEQYLEQLATNISLDAGDRIVVEPLFDRRFDQPFSGLYWQVEIDGSKPILSRSLWGKQVSTPSGLAPGSRFQNDAESPTGSPVLVSGWVITIGEGPQARQVSLAVAIDSSEVLVAAEGFQAYLVKWLGLMLVGLIIASWVQIGFGLAPLRRIYRKVEAVKNGSETRLTGEFPTEVQPLVDEVNILLEAHEKSLAEARAKASDLAHGLKTPLTVMRAITEQLESDIDPARAREIEDQISSMHRFIERELAQVRKTRPNTVKTQVLPAVEHMVASMKKLPRGDALAWQVQLPDDLRIPFDQHDLAELLGNILDNARKWARSTVRISGQTGKGSAGSLRIQDDGPGVPDALIEAIPERGAFTGDLANGHGLGLAICKDLVESVNGRILLTPARDGGLAVDIIWS